MKMKLIGAAMICCSFLVSSCIAQNEFKLENSYSSQFSELEYDDLFAIQNLKMPMVMNFSKGFNDSIPYKVAILNVFEKPLYKVLKLDGSYDIISACGYDSDRLALFVGTNEKKPIKIFKLKDDNVFSLSTEIRIRNSTLKNGVENIHYLNKYKLLLSSTYNFSQPKGELDIIRLGIMDTRSGKVSKSLEFDFGKSILYSYFPKQWVSVNSNWIVLIDPLKAKLFVFNHGLEEKYCDSIEFLRSSGTISTLDNIFNPNTLLSCEYNPKKTIDIFLKNNLLNYNRIEKVFLTDNNHLIISSIKNKGYKDKRFVTIYDIEAGCVIDTFSVYYNRIPGNGLFEFRYTGGRFFTSMNNCIIVRHSRSIVKDSMQYMFDIFHYNPEAKDTENLSIDKLSNMKIINEYGKFVSIDSLRDFKEIIFIDKYVCKKCLNSLNSNVLVIVVDSKKSIRNRILKKNEINKKYGLINVLFLNEEFDHLTDIVKLNQLMLIDKIKY